MPSTTVPLVLALSVGSLAAFGPPSGDDRGSDAEMEISFGRDVRPILSDACFQCHGPDEKARKAGLRLDTREGATADLGGYAAIAPGDVEGSELYQRLIAEEADVRMPPPNTGKALSDEQIRILRAWIESGAEYEDHWAYRPVRRPAIPDPVPAAGPEAGPIDRFVADKLARLGIEPGPQADRRALIRRLSFDLIGLPPTPEEVEAFENDPAPDAYERLVDRLLASPRYGERMAVHWLDLARYSDTIGYHSDVHRDVWLYRDYVIDAFNRNLPFDRFTIEQLAGDLLPNATDSQRIASGYNMMLMTTEEGGSQPKEYTAKYSADRTRNTASLWLGLTMGCAECHDHKYDPITTKDFYSFAAYFADLRETPVGRQPSEKFPTAEQKAELAAIAASLAEVEAALAADTPELAADFERWSAALGRRLASRDWISPAPSSARMSERSRFRVDADGTLTAVGENPERIDATLTYRLGEGDHAALRLDALADESLPAGGPGRASNGNFVLNEFRVEFNGAPVKLTAAAASHEQRDLPAAAAIDGNPATGWAIAPETGRDHALIAIPESPIRGPGELTVTLRQTHGSSHTIGKFRVRLLRAGESGEPGIDLADHRGIPVRVERALIAGAGLEGADRDFLRGVHRATTPILADLRAERETLAKRSSEIDQAVPTMQTSMSGEPRVVRILPRGNWLDDSGPAVEPAPPAFLPDPVPVAEGARATRLDLARWMVAPENPLVARVFVNRMWRLMFGRGIVSTVGDFGSQGAAPTHPELLDWLAADFVESGWDVKRLLRAIATSDAYRRSSAAPESDRAVDPANDWLAWQGRFRLEAEFVRDNALAVSGLLSPRIGGPSAKPYQPPGYWAYLNFPRREWRNDVGEGLYRRGLYTYWCRTFLHPSLLAFDASTREECVGERARSNTPPQALTLLNDPTYVEAARVLAARLLRAEADGVDARLDALFRLALQRPAIEAERAALRELLDAHLAHYRARPEAAAALSRVGAAPAPPAEEVDPAELAAWTSVCRAVMNLHEFVTRS